MRIVRTLAAYALLAACAGAWSSCRDSSASGNGGGGAQASAQASAEPKDVELPGVDTSAMTPRERHEFSAMVDRLLAPCPQVPVPVSQCVLEKRACPPCMQAAKWIASAVRQGASDEQIERAYKARFDPSTAHALPVDGSPAQGPDEAPVTIVEFADFECPHCREAVPALDAIVAAHKGKVRLVFKVFPLPKHVHAIPAARAAFAAGVQGKFWEMHHLLFERQDHLEDGDLERYAHILKLDVARWKLDMDSQAVKDRIDHDRKMAEDLKLVGTPGLFVNGRELDLEGGEEIEDRVATELGETRAAPAPSASASAAPPPSAPAAASAKPH